MLIIDRWRKWRTKRAYNKRHEAVIASCGCACYCPNCHDILNDQAACVDDADNELVYYTCRNCGHKSIWTFDAAPVPVLLSGQENLGVEAAENMIFTY